MSFRVMARTLLHLGAQLISSDAVALFELVKNSFDAGSSQVKIEVVVRIPHQKRLQLVERVRSIESQVEISGSDSLKVLRSAAADAVDRTAPRCEHLIVRLRHAEDLSEFRKVLNEANYITVSDTGEGMSLDILDDVFLTIGTRSRLRSRAQRHIGDGDRPILGEKGVGRLSAMRLGEYLHVETSISGEDAWNVLDIDWSIFSHDSEALLDEFDLEPGKGSPKENPIDSGTRLTISDLTSEWTETKLRDLATQEFTKLTDPFTSETVFPVQLLFNDQPVSVPRFDRVLLDNAHAYIAASFNSQNYDGMRLAGHITYKGRERVFALEGAHLLSPAECSIAVLENLGPFSLDVYWYNRRILTALEGIGDQRSVLRLVREWGGGVMVFRDGFRVLPYGNAADDWLNLDRRALGSSGYAINKSQIIGRLNISSMDNPALTDQTNREGITDCGEKSALVNLLNHIIQSEFRTFLNEVDEEQKAMEPISIDELDRRVQEEEQQIIFNVNQLMTLVPELRREAGLVNRINTSVGKLRALMSEVQELAESYQAGRGQLLNLAGIGLSVEVLAHELNRVTDHVLQTIGQASLTESGSDPALTLRMLETQLRTLQRRLRVLDPLSTAGRQRRERFDLVSLINDFIDDHSERFAREGISCSFEVGPNADRKTLQIRAVKGMIIQIFGNLIDNSIYWLRQQKTLDPTQESTITVTLDTDARYLTVSDNGPGVPMDMQERIFDAFFTTKPAGQGKGLGLFIGREIARYHGADLELLPAASNGNKTCHTFRLTLGESTT